MHLLEDKESNYTLLLKIYAYKSIKHAYIQIDS